MDDPGLLDVPRVPWNVSYWVLKVILSPIFLLLWRLRVEGRENLPRHGPAVIAANHQSFCDSLFLPLIVPRRLSFLAKAEYFESWRTAWFFKAVGQIPIRRGGGDASERALATAREVLAKGRLVGLYPEGTRSTDEFVHRGRTGVARLAVQCAVPVIPVGLSGTEVVQPIGSCWLRPFHRISIRIGPPMMAVSSSGLESDDSAALRAFTDELMRQIAGLSGRQYLDQVSGARSRDESVS